MPSAPAPLEIHETVWIPMPDGARLAARLWLPPQAHDTPVPALLEYIPYRRRDRTRMRDESMHPHFAAAGYACLRVDMRGAGDSDGTMPDEYARQEIQDGADVVQWIAAQPWCDGNVGMFGKSWGAYSAFQVAALRPPALKAIAPVMGTDDRWLEDIHFYGGVLAGDNFWWGCVMQLLNALPPDPETAGADHWKALWKRRLDAMTFWPALWLEHQTRDDMWRRGSISENYADIEIPVYFFGGWADLFRDTPFRIAEHLTPPLKLLMGPWAHLYPHEASPLPNMDFIAEATRFWDHWLKGQDTGLYDEPPLRFWMLAGALPAGSHAERPGRWVEEPAWPSPNVAESVMHLNNGALDADARAGDEMSVCSPQSFGLGGGDMCSFAIPGDMPTDCRKNAAGALVFRAPPQETPLDILGQPRLELRLRADRPQAFVAALLVDEAEDGAQTLISRGFANLMHRDGDLAPKPVVPGEEMTVTLPFHGIGYRLAKGHRLLLQIASTYWPILWPSPEPATLRMAAGASRLRLPIRRAPANEPAPRSLPEPPARPPLPVSCVSEGSMKREIIEDLATGIFTERFFVDGGVFGPSGRTRLEETGTELRDICERVYSIHPRDPLSARAAMSQESFIERGEWKARLKTFAEQTADKENFRLRARVECWLGDELFHEVDWNHTIPRNGM